MHKAPTIVGSRRGDSLATLPPFSKRLIPRLKPAAYFWWKALAITPRQALKRLIIYQSMLINCQLHLKISHTIHIFYLCFKALF